MNLFKLIVQQIQESKKRELLNYLNGLSDAYLEELGFSQTLMKQGVKAWPWSNEITQLEKHVIVEQTNTSELNTNTDAQLHDLENQGSNQGNIDRAVRFGHEGIEQPIKVEVA